MPRNQGRLGSFQEDGSVIQEDATAVPAFMSTVAQTFGTSPSSSPLEFVVPTEHVDLPSRGRFYPEGHPLKNQETVEIRYMTAKEEDILTSQNLIKKGIVLDRLVQSVVLDKRIDPTQLLVGDKAAILIATRVTGYGPTYSARITCPSCLASQQHEFSLYGLPNHQGGIESTDADVVPSTLGNGVFSVALDKTPAVRFHLKLLTGVDEQRITAISEKRKKHNIAEGFLMTQLEMIVVGVEFNNKIVQGKSEIQGILGNLPAHESRHIRNVYTKLTPTVSLEQDFVCESCSAEEKIDIPVTTDFFWPKNK